MTHAQHGHECKFCDRVSFGNGGAVAHARSHVRRGEAVELVKHYATDPPMSSRLFFIPGDAAIQTQIERGFSVVESVSRT